MKVDSMVAHLVVLWAGGTVERLAGHWGNLKASKWAERSAYHSAVTSDATSGAYLAERRDTC